MMNMKYTFIFCTLSLLIIIALVLSCRLPLEAKETITEKNSAEEYPEMVPSNESREIAPIHEREAETAPEIPVNERREEQPAEVGIDWLINPGGTVIHQQDGLYFVHYFPNTASLKSDESEILLYNLGTQRAQIISSDQQFVVQGKTYEQYSGTWEKFPTYTSWERMQYVNIEPSYYNNEPLILEPGQKGKLHWHYRFEGEIWGKEQKVKISVQYKIGTVSYDLNKDVTRLDPGPRPSEEGYAEGNSGSGQEVNHQE